jgi:hypothetical protein
LKDFIALRAYDMAHSAGAERVLTPIQNLGNLEIVFFSMIYICLFVLQKINPPSFEKKIKNWHYDSDARRNFGSFKSI